MSLVSLRAPTGVLLLPCWRAGFLLLLLARKTPNVMARTLRQSVFQPACFGLNVEDTECEDDDDAPNAIASVEATPRAPRRDPPPRRNTLPGAPTRILTKSQSQKASKVRGVRIQPLDCGVSARGSPQVTLSWDPPANDGGCPIERYAVHANPVDPLTRSIAVDRMFSREHQVVIENLETCETYRFEVREPMGFADNGISCRGESMRCGGGGIGRIGRAIG